MVVTNMHQFGIHSNQHHLVKCNTAHNCTATS